jgi:hypothetical protein
VDRYVEQLWDTMFAKAPEMMLFNWALLTQPSRAGERDKWSSLQTSFDYEALNKSAQARNANGGPPIMARVAGSALEQVDGFLGKLGNPIGIASYKPYHSTGEDFLHDYLGMIGIPIDLHPEFPTNASLVLLTESAKFDPEIVRKIKDQLSAGKSVVITSGLLRALQGKGIEDIVELQYTDRKFLAKEYASGFGAGSGVALAQDDATDILFPDIDFLTNDAWALVRALAGGRSYPLLLMDRYSKGVLYVWTMPDNFNDLYRLPRSTVSAFKDYVMSGFPIRLDGPSQVALFAYDNDTLIVESFLPTEAEVKVSVAGAQLKLRNLVNGEEISGQRQARPLDRRRPEPVSPRMVFDVKLLPHSYSVFAVERQISEAESSAR